MNTSELKKQNMEFVLKGICEYAINPFGLIDTMRRAYNDYTTNEENAFGIERNDLLQGTQNKGFFFVCGHEAEALLGLNGQFPEFIDFRRKLANLNDSQIINPDYSLVEVPFERQGYKMGLHICGYTRDGEGSFEPVENPLNLATGTGLEQLAVLYATKLNSDVDYEKHKELLVKYLERSAGILTSENGSYHIPF